jgi:hypothetical protein
MADEARVLVAERHGMVRDGLPACAAVLPWESLIRAVADGEVYVAFDPYQDRTGFGRAMKPRKRPWAVYTRSRRNVVDHAWSHHATPAAAALAARKLNRSK